MGLASGDTVGTPLDPPDSGDFDSEECEGCDGSGVRAPATPRCILEDRGPEWMVVERCDCCEVFEDDFVAAQSIAEDAEWVTCDQGGWHVLARRLLE